jgi:hypothetical protein
MKQHLALLLAVSSVGLLTSCEVPASPDFDASQKVEVKILNSTEFQFLGGKKALLDTTKGDISDFIKTDPNGTVSISTTEDFDFGDLNDAIPVISVAPTTVNAEVGPLRLNEFSSDSGPDGLGKASFQQLTGINPALVPAGTLLPAGGSPSPVNINLATNYLVSATIQSGSIVMTLNNKLGFNLNTVNVSVRSGSTTVGQLSFTNLAHNTVQTSSLVIPNGTVLASINVNVSIAWNQQFTVANPNELIVQNVAGDALEASQVVAAIGPQSFSTAGTIVVAEDQFLFTQPGDYIEVESGTLDINRIANNMGLGIESFVLSLPSIRRAPYGVGDSLVIRFEGATALTSGRVIENFLIPLANMRIIAPNNVVRYSVAATTQDLRQGSNSTPATLRAADNVFASVGISNLAIRTAIGTIVTKSVDLNENDPSNGTNIDLFNDVEANLITLDGIEDLSDKIEGLQFTDARLAISYQTNIGIGAKVVGSFVGVDAKGQTLYLTGKPGSPLFVSSNPHTDLTANGTTLSASQMIQFELATSTDGSMISGSIDFDNTNSTIIDFLNKLPVEIRFIGKAVINEDNERGQISQPVRFEPQILVDIPLSIQTVTAAVYEDTLDVDMAELPGPEEDTKLKTASITINYVNKLPLEINIALDFMDENFAVLTSSPRSGQAATKLSAAPVSSNGFVVPGGRAGTMVIELNQAQMDVLNRTRHIGLRTSLLTTDNGAVRIRAQDGFSMSLNGSFSITTSFSN